MTKGTKHPNAAPLTTAEVKEAIEASGYPVEVELLNELRDAKFWATIGARYAVAPNKFQEIDVVGALTRKAKADEGSILVSSSLLIQAKKLSGPASFVGVLGRQANGPDQMTRLGLVGSVMFEDAGEPGVPELILGSDDDNPSVPSQVRPLVDATMPFHDLPQCVHWAIARRKNKDHEGWIPWASGEQGFFDDFEALVQVREMQKVDAQGSRLQRQVDHVAGISSLTLCMLIDADTLYLYDPTKRAIETVGEFSVCKGFDTVHGPIYPYIDCVARPAFKAYLERCRQSARLFLRSVRSQPDEIVRLAKALRSRAEVEYLNSIPRRGIFSDER